MSDLQANMQTEINIAGQQEIPKYQPPTFPNKATDEELSKNAYRRVANFYETCKSERDKFWSKHWETCYKVMFGLTDRRVYKGKANIAVPELYRCVKNIQPRLVSMVFGVDPFFRVLPRDKGQDASAEGWSDVMRGYIQKSKLKPKFTALINSAAIYGTAFGKVYWKRDTRRQVVPQKTQTGSIPDPVSGSPIGTQSIVRPELQQAIVYEGPNLDVLDICDVYMRVLAKSVQDGDGIIHERVMTLAQMKQEERNGVFINVDECKIDNEGTEDQAKTNRWNFQGQGDDKTPDYSGPDKYVIWEYWGPFDLNGDGEEIECVIAVDKRSKTVVRLQENPLWSHMRPFIAARVDPTADEFYSLGIIGPHVKVQMFLNAMANNTLDLAAMQLNPPVIAGAGADIPENQIRFELGRVFRVAGDASQIQPFTVTGNVGSGHRMMQTLQEMLREGTGATQSLSGLQDPNASTAYAYGAMIENSTARVASMAEVLEEALEDCLKQYMSLIQQYVTQPTMISVAGAKGANVREFYPAGAGMNFDIEVFGTAVRKEQIATAQKLEKFTQTWAPVLDPAAQLRLARESFRLYGLRGADDIFPQPGNMASINPDQENDMLLRGVSVMPKPMDDDLTHMKAHEAFISSGLFMEAFRGNQEVGQLFSQHMHAHEAQMQQKMMAQQQAALPQNGAGSPPPVPPNQNPAPPQQGPQGPQNMGA